MNKHRIVLVAPMYAGNVGAVARVAANFGVADVVLVAPACDWKGQDARRFAKGAGAGVLDAITEAPTLAKALAGCAAAVGFTRRTGAGRLPTVALGGVARLGLDSKPAAPVALVFGREDSGLTAGELATCTHICSLAVAPAQASINLSHAVAVVAARIFEARLALEAQARAAAPARAAPPAPVETVHALFTHLEQALRDAGLTRGGNPEKLLAKLRPMLARGEPTTEEIAALRTYLSKTQVALGTKVNPRRRARSTS